MRRFLLISVCLHAVAALLLLHTDANRDDFLQPGQTIELTLQAFSEPVQQAAATPVPAQHVSPQRMTPTPAARQHKPSAPAQRLASSNRETQQSTETAAKQAPVSAGAASKAETSAGPATVTPPTTVKPISADNKPGGTPQAGEPPVQKDKVMPD